MEKKQSFKQTVLEQLDSHVQKNKPRQRPHNLHKINLKQTTDLKVKCKIIKLLGKKQENICMVWVWFDVSILDVIPKAQSIEKNINKLDFAKIRNGLCERHY